MEVGRYRDNNSAVGVLDLHVMSIGNTRLRRNRPALSQFGLDGLE